MINFFCYVCVLYILLLFVSAFCPCLFYARAIFMGLILRKYVFVGLVSTCMCKNIFCKFDLRKDSDMRRVLKRAFDYDRL